MISRILRVLASLVMVMVMVMVMVLCLFGVTAQSAMEATFATVVSYDRANSGWSDPVERPAGAAIVVADLHAALAAAGLPAPYLLVGHSIGGYYAEQFAATFPGEMAGLVLLDPSPIGWRSAFPKGMVESIESQQSSIMLLQVAAALGVTRLWNPLEASADGLPEPARSELLAATLRSSQLRSTRFDAEVFLDVGDDKVWMPDLGNRPVLVISAGVSVYPAYDDWEAAQWAAHEQLTRLSARAGHVILPDAGHVSLLTDRKCAHTVALLIRSVYEECEWL